jgi:hypothetical protein
MHNRGAELTAERLRALLSYDPVSGVLVGLIKPSQPVRAGAVAGGINHGYRRIKIGRRIYGAHRLAWLYMTGEWPCNEIDHINCDRADNRWCNLREATDSQQFANAYVRADNTPVLRAWSGIRRRRDGLHRSRLITSPTISTPERAFIAYIFAAWRHFGDFARIDADYLSAIRKRKAVEHSVLGNLANPDYASVGGLNLFRRGGGVGRGLCSFTRHGRPKAGSSTAFRVEGERSAAGPWLGQPGAGHRGGLGSPCPGPPRQFWVKVND